LRSEGDNLAVLFALRTVASGAYAASSMRAIVAPFFDTSSLSPT
jgi:hypothetical protein